MKKNILFIIISLFALVSCFSSNNTNTETNNTGVTNNEEINSESLYLGEPQNSDIIIESETDNNEEVVIISDKTDSTEWTSVE